MGGFLSRRCVHLPAKKKNSNLNIIQSIRFPGPRCQQAAVPPLQHNLRINNNDDCSHLASLDPCGVRPVLLGESALPRSADQLGSASQERVPSRATLQQGGRDEGYRWARAARLRGSSELMGSHDSMGLCSSDGQGYGSGRGGHELVCLWILARAHGVYPCIHLHRDPHNLLLPNCCFHGEFPHTFSPFRVGQSLGVVQVLCRLR